MSEEKPIPEEAGVVFQARSREFGGIGNFVTLADGRIYSGETIFKTYDGEEFAERYEVV